MPVYYDIFEWRLSLFNIHDRRDIPVYRCGWLKLVRLVKPSGMWYTYNLQLSTALVQTKLVSAPNSLKDAIWSILYEIIDSLQIWENTPHCVS